MRTPKRCRKNYHKRLWIATEPDPSVYNYKTQWQARHRASLQSFTHPSSVVPEGQGIFPVPPHHSQRVGSTLLLESILRCSKAPRTRDRFFFDREYSRCISFALRATFSMTSFENLLFLLRAIIALENREKRTLPPLFSPESEEEINEGITHVREEAGELYNLPTYFCDCVHTSPDQSARQSYVASPSFSEKPRSKMTARAASR